MTVNAPPTVVAPLTFTSSPTNKLFSNLDIEGVESLEVANQMKAVIQEAMPAIQQIEISNIANGVAHLVISYKGWTEQLYEELLASNIAQRHKIQIVGVTGNKITATKV